MKIIVIGNGKVGKSLIEQLQIEGHDITVIDKKISKLEELNNSSDVLCINGDGVNVDVLLESGVSNADLLISVTSSDEFNIVSSMIAKKLGAKNVVARIRSREYIKQRRFIKRDLNIDFVINPELRTAKEIANQFKFVGDFKVESFSKGLVDILSFKLDNENKLNNLSLFEINKKYNVKMLVCAVERGSEVFIPSGDFNLTSGDIIHIIAANKDIHKIIEIIGKDDEKTNSVIIIGAGKITYYLANELFKLGLDVKIIDSDLNVCEEMAELLPKATIIHGDATNQNLLEEEGLYNLDAFISLTGNDEINIILSLYAKTKKIKKIITKVNQGTYSDLIKDLGLTNIFTPKEVITGNIITYVRSLDNVGKNSADSIHRLVSNKVEALEFTINSSFNKCNIPLKNMKLANNILIAGVVRKGEFIIADGNLELKENDSIIVISNKKIINELNDILGD